MMALFPDKAIRRCRAARAGRYRGWCRYKGSMNERDPCGKAATEPEDCGNQPLPVISDEAARTVGYVLLVSGSPVPKRVLRCARLPRLKNALDQYAS